MPLKEIVIRADSIDDAAEEIIGFLGRSRHESVIYLDGYYQYGLGASAILKAVVERLRSSLSRAATRKATGFDKIIHIDCSLWQSKRTLQKAIAEELKLPQEVMAFFDQGDEEDDFDGVQQSARGVIPEVKGAILNELSSYTFLVVFHNGSGNYVDLWECGVPVLGVMSNRVLWTSRGRFLFHGIQNEDVKELAGLSDVAISVLPQVFIDNEDVVGDIFRRFLHAEAEEVARYSGVPEPGTKIVLECFLYKAFRQKGYDINWGTHAANYWVCDGIIHDANDCGRSAWEIGDALHRDMNLDWNKYIIPSIVRLLCDKQWRCRDRWVSATDQGAAAAQAPTSFFWRAATIEGRMFEHLDRSRLRVLHLSDCIFSFSSPPFLSCSNLRFLLLDHCEDKNDEPDHGEEQDCSQGGDDGAYFRKLWVLELSYTDWYGLLSKKMLDLMAELRELSVKGPGNWSMSHLHSCSGAGSNSRRVLKLRVVEGAEAADNDKIGSPGGHRNQQVSSFPDLSSWHILNTIILDGCGELEEIGYNTLPPALDSFHFTSNIATKIKSISFQGCATLKSLLLKGLFDMLEELDMSGTSVTTLDLSEMQALHLRRLFLLGCEKLRAILWPRDKHELEVLHIDTTDAAWEDKSNKQEATKSTSAESSSVAAGHVNSQVLSNLHVYISLRDPRLFRSLLRVRLVKHLHVDISSIGSHKGAGQGNNNSKQGVRAVNRQNAAGNLYVDDITSTFKDSLHTTDDVNGDDVVDAAAIKWMWPCPPIPMGSDWAHCYISIQDDKSTKQERSTTLPGFVHENARTLHLHDSLSITSIPGPAPDPTTYLYLDWNGLQWCRLERCPNLEAPVFVAPRALRPGAPVFFNLDTFGASQLLKARYIWDWNASFSQPGYQSFGNLVFLHLDYCPRLVHVLPLYNSNVRGCRSLETLEIMCCGELREVFPSDSGSQQQEPRQFPSLKRIHLHELPALQRICGRRMLAPELETVKIRGCWSLKRLPAIGQAPCSSSESDEEETHTLPSVDCEKDWWGSLEWDGEEVGHHPSHYRPTHSAYYKKTLLRASVLR